jgi:hypothetical protein
MHQSLTGDPGPESHPGFIGEVIWFQRLRRAHSGFAYGYGIRLW